MSGWSCRWRWLTRSPKSLEPSSNAGSRLAASVLLADDRLVLTVGGLSKLVAVVVEHGCGAVLGRRSGIMGRMPTIRLLVPEGPVPLDLEDPTEEEVLRAVRALDGSETTELYLQPDREHPETYLAIAGGVSGQYLVFICLDNEQFIEAISPGADGPPVDLICGGQPGQFEPSQLISLEGALRAASQYYRSRSPSEAVDWIRR